MRGYKKRFGAEGEAIAQNIYIKRGFKILEQNFFNRKGKSLGEVDFIAARDKDIRFVEVKTRASSRFGDPAEAITFQKKARLSRAIRFFLFKMPEYHSYKLHLDVVTIQICGVDKRAIKVKIYSDAMVDKH